MLSAKEELAHVVAGLTENADKVTTAIELLKIAARLLYQDGRPECIQAGEQVDAILKDLMTLGAEKMLQERLAEISQSFARSLVALIQRDQKKNDE